MTINGSVVRRSAMWAGGGAAIQIISQIAAIVVLARLLTPYEFGVVSAATLVTQLSMIFSEFGVGPFVIQRRDIRDCIVGTAHFLSCLTGVLVCTSFWFFAPFIASLLHVPELIQVLRAYSVLFLISGAYAVHDSLSQRDMDFKYLARADAVSFVVGYAALSIVFALLGFSYWSLVIGHVSQASIRCAIVRMRHKQVSRNPVEIEKMKEIAGFGIGQTFSRLASFTASQADGFIVTSRLGVAAIGHYGRANQLVTMPAAQLGQIFDKLIFPIVARSQHEHSRAAATYRAALSGIGLLSFPVSVILWMLGAEVVHVALGSQWEQVIDPMRVLALAIPFRLIHKVSDPTARAMGKTWSRAWRQWLVAFAVIGFTVVLSEYGITMVAWGVVASAVLDACLMMWLCCTVTKLSISDLLRALVPGISVGVVVMFIAGLIMSTPASWRQSDMLVLVVTGVLSLAAIGMFARKYRQMVVG